MKNSDRLLVILKYLQDNSDAGISVSSRELLDMLAEKGCEARVTTLRRDILALQRAGYDICEEKAEGIATRYSYVSRSWDTPELQIMIDAVNACLFLTPKKSNDIIGRLRSLAGPSAREILAPKILVEDRIKAQNEQILYIVQDIMRAIDGKRQIRFRHFTYDVNRNRVPRHDGYEYTLSPYALIWQEDRYYVIGYSQKHGRIAKFRVDRMEKPRVLKKAGVPMPEDLDLKDYVSKIFRMYDDGPVETVTLRCAEGMEDQVIDHFGPGTEFKPVGPDRFDVTVTVNLSSTFYGWLFQYPGKMTLISPESAREKYTRMLEEAMDHAQAGE